MATVNHRKKEKMFHRVVSDVISTEIKNANISHVTVTDVKLSGDGSHIKIFVTFVKNKDRSFENLQKTTGFIRTALSKRLALRKIPEIHFHHDLSIENGAKIDQILKNIKSHTQEAPQGFVLSVKKDMKIYSFSEIDSIEFENGKLTIAIMGKKLEIYENISEEQANGWLNDFAVYQKITNK